MRPRRTTTAPTGGFGLVRPSPRRARATARAMKRASSSRIGRSAPARLAGAFRAPLFDQLLQLVHELADVLERAVDGREADVRDGVEAVQLAHERLPDERA